MIISHKYKFIFLKTNKTAGTSIEIALSKFCGPDDIITPISSEDEKIREKLGFRGPQNYLSPIWDYRVRDIFKWVVKGIKKVRFYNHISAEEVKERVGTKTWDSYYKFCFERNPWDRAISLYYWRNQSEPRPTVSEFISSDIPLVLKEKGFEVYAIDGEIAVDKVCKFEELSEELEVVREEVGIPGKLELPKTKSRFRRGNRDYRNIMTEKDKARIRELFRDEIEFLGYQW